MMSPTDDLLLGHLEGLLVEHPQVRDTLESWWKRERQANESFTRFLCRKKVLIADAGRTLDMIARGYLDTGCLSSLLGGGGLKIVEEILVLEESRNSVRSAPSNSTFESAFDFDPEEPAVPTTALPEQTPVDLRVFRSPAEESRTRTTIRQTVETRHAIHASNEITRTVVHAQESSAGTATRKAWPPPPGTVLGKYLLTEQIGQGTSGVVFRALNMVLNLPVALKALRVPEHLSTQQVLEGLTEEARVLAHLNHPNVIRLWDFEADPSYPYIVMEYVEGLNLADLIKQSGTLSPNRVAEIGAQVILGLAAAWKLGVVHRDVKPHNILITREGTPKIVDLGLALVVDQNSQLFNPKQTGELGGTAAYMAPEQAQGARDLDHRADIYSLGATLYHALTGRLPYNGQTPREIMLRHAQERPVPPHLLTPGVPKPLSDVVMIMMSREANDRFQTAEEIVEALQSSQTPTMSPYSEEGSATQSEPMRSSPATRRSGFWKRLFTGD